MGFLGFISAFVGLVAFVMAMRLCYEHGASRTSVDTTDVVIATVVAVIAVPCLFGAGYCIG